MTSPLSYDRLRELLEAKASSLPWAYRAVDRDGFRVRDEILDGEGRRVTDDIIFDTDAALIVAAVNALPDLLTRIADLEGENARVSLALEEILNASSVGKAGQTVSFRSKYANYPARLYHAGRTALRALSGTDTGEKVGG